jgi:hypothetical protein
MIHAGVNVKTLQTYLAHASTKTATDRVGIAI